MIAIEHSKIHYNIHKIGTAKWCIFIGLFCDLCRILRVLPVYLNILRDIDEKYCILELVTGTRMYIYIFIDRSEH